MPKESISIIAALGASTRAIGRKNGLIWGIEGDLPRFKGLTMGHPIIMGRKTFESIGKALPGRTNIMVTRGESGVWASGCLLAYSLEQALNQARGLDNNEIFIIGGGQIYAQAILLADRLYLTVVDDKVLGDTFFPDYSAFTRVISQEQNAGPPPNEFLILEH